MNESNAWTDNDAQGRQNPGSAIRLFSTERGAIEPWPPSKPPSAQMTLSQFFYHSHLPRSMTFARPSHIKEVETSLRYWARFTLDPPLCQIGDHHAQGFLAGLAALRGIQRGSKAAANTIRKHVIHVQGILDSAGPPVRRRKWRAALLVQTPFIERPPVVIDRRIKRATVGEIGALLNAFGAAVCSPTGLRGVPPHAWWECLTLVGYNVGLPIGVLRNLRFDWIDQDDVGHWLRVPADVVGIKRSRGGRDYCLNRFAVLAIDRMRAHGQDLVFPWNRTDNTLWRTLKRVHLVAKIPFTRRFAFHAFRKACGTELARINPMAVPMQLGHASADARRGDVTIDHYVALQILAEAIEKLPQPVRLDGHQRLLF